MAEYPRPAGVTVALKGIPTSAVLATGQRNAALAVLAVEAELAAALVGTFAVSLEWITMSLALRHIAQVALPTLPRYDSFHYSHINRNAN